jgi:hypothetical protein
MKTKDELYEVVQTWYSDLALIREKHPLFQVCRGNVCENPSC